MDLKELMTTGKELGYEGEELRQFVEKERARVKEEQDRERARLKEEQDREREERKLAREERQLAMEMEREKLEMERERLAKELERDKIAAEVELAKLRLSAGMDVERTDVKVEPGAGGMSRYGDKPFKLPYFDEKTDDMHCYLTIFEDYAKMVKCKPEYWSFQLGRLLKGEAQRVYARLMPSGGSCSYEELKRELLARFQLTDEGFRKKFRGTKPDSGETSLQFVRRMSSYLDRWIDLGKVGKTYNELRDLLLREQFLNACDKDLNTYLRERKPKDVENMAE